MDLFKLFGFIAALSIFAFTVYLSVSNASVLLDQKSALMVLGGTIAVSFVCFSFGDIKKLLIVFFKRVLRKNTFNYEKVISDVTDLVIHFQKGRDSFYSKVNSIEDPIIRDSAVVLFWLEAEVDPDKIRHLLENKIQTHYSNYTADAAIFQTIAKFPPAFGLMGTTLGMIALLQGLGKAGASSNIGPAMAIALMTTLYGLALSNFILTPIAESLQRQTKEDTTVRLMIVEGLMLMQQGESKRYVEAAMRSFLLPSQQSMAKDKAA